MLKSKKKALFVDYSEFSILAARTSSSTVPMQIEAIMEIPLDTAQSGQDLFESFYDFGGTRFAQAVCGVYPNSRFVHVHEFDSVGKARDPKNLETTLQEKFKVDTAKMNVEVLSGKDGESFDFKSGNEKSVLFCGAAIDEFQDWQDRLLKLGVYPLRLEMGSIATIGAVADFALFEEVKGPVLFFEMKASGALISVINKGGIDDARVISSGLDSIFPLLQAELGLKDESSARRIFFSNTFDFAEMGPKLLRNVIRELQASIGSYEVKTGQMIEHIFVSLLPKNLSWISRTLSSTLGVQTLRVDYARWLNDLGVEVGDAVDLSNLGSRWLGLFSLLGEYQQRTFKQSEQDEVKSDTAPVAN